jgi:hypothetical protein
MKYEGKLYGKVGEDYFDTGKTSEDWDNLEIRLKEARELLKKYYEGRALYTDVLRAAKIIEFLESEAGE